MPLSAGGDRGGDAYASAHAWSALGQWAGGAARGASHAAQKWRPAWAVLASYAPVAARLHLALFYFYGVYYHWAKRATGARTCAIPRILAFCAGPPRHWLLYMAMHAARPESWSVQTGAAHVCWELAEFNVWEVGYLHGTAPFCATVSVTCHVAFWACKASGS